MAVGVIVTGVVWCVRKEVGVGWQGSAPSFYIRGKWAVLLGVAVIAGASYFLIMNGALINGDPCLVSSGSHSPQEKNCS